MSIDREQTLSINRKGWDKVAAKFYGGTALPKYGPLAKTEEELNLIENLKHEAVLELGCGSGHSLYYLWKHDYVNGIIEAGLVLERLVESELNVELAREKDYAPEKWYSVSRAQLIPTMFIVKARKPK